MKTPEESLGIDSNTYNKIVDECVYGEQKPADLEEPDFFDDFRKSDVEVDSNEDGLIAETIRYKNEKKPAWSEEDKANLSLILQVLWNKTKIGAETCKKLEDWLKSLRPQSHWKPSDEQMRVLDIAIRCGIIIGTSEETTLILLFNDLKKLREE